MLDGGIVLPLGEEMGDHGTDEAQAWLQELLERHERPLIRYAARLTGDLESARDVVQEAFLRLCAKRPQAKNNHVAPWLYTVCRRRALDVRRKDRRMTAMSEQTADSCESTAPNPVALAEDRQTTSRVLRLLETLPENQQEVVRLKFQGGLRYREISEVTGLSVSNVGVLLHTAIKRLREELGSREA